MDDNDTSSETCEPSWDERHNDPQAEIILVSNDQVSFRVSSWYFKEKSAFIRDLVTIPSSESLETAPIPIDQSSRHVRIFVDLVYSADTGTIPIEMDDFKPVLFICEQLQALEIQTSLWRGFRTSIPTTTAASLASLWELFGMAARVDDNLACSEIATVFHRKNLHFDDVLSQQPSFYQGIPARYLAVLFTGNFQWSHKNSGNPSYRPRSYEAMAQRFARMKDGDLDVKIGDGPSPYGGFTF